MPEFKPITIRDREIFEKHLRASQLSSSEFTFANFFIWRHYDNSAWALINDNLCVLARPAGQPAYFFPPLGGHKTVETVRQCLEIMKQEGLSPLVSHIPKDFADKYLGQTDGLILEADRDNFDYVYLIEELCQLKGRKFSAQRNHLKNFLSRHDPKCLELTADLVPACRKILVSWSDNKEQLNQTAKERHYLAGSVQAAQELLDHWTELKLIGAVVLVGDGPVAFSAGERIGPEMGVTYLEIVNRRYHGLNQYINKEFSCRLGGDLKYINREQDLGFPGLRKAKLAYHPHHFIEKYNCYPRSSVTPA